MRIPHDVVRALKGALGASRRVLKHASPQAPSRGFSPGIIVGAMALTLATPRAGHAQGGPTAPPVIDTVIVRTHDVFDSSEARRNVLLAVANAIRFQTKPQIVRRELLFRAGEPYDSAKVAETARNLRALGLFRRVSIDTARIGGRLAAIVDTRDGWTTQVQANARSTGGEFTWSAGLTEQDFLGLAIGIGAEYRKDPDRTAVMFLANWQRIGATRLALDASYDDRSDGQLGTWSLGAPWRAYTDPASIIWQGEAGRYRVLQFRDGDTSNILQRRVLRVELSGGLAPYAAAGGYLRLGPLVQIKREAYVPWADTLSPVPDSVSAALGLQLAWRRARFKVVTHYNGFAREEDVDLSTRVSVTAWVAPGAFGYARSGVGPSVDLQTGVDLGRVFGRLDAIGGGLVTGDGLDSARVTGTLTVASQVLHRQATVLRVEAGLQRRLPPGAEFDLGHGVGPRAFESHAFTGSREVWGTIEHRWFAVDEVLHLLGVGFAAFADYGGAWYANESPRAGGDVGLGLRLGATRSTGPNVGRLDLAYRFGDGWSGSRWVVSFGRAYEF